jgi:hypothetical protein
MRAEPAISTPARFRGGSDERERDAIEYVSISLRGVEKGLPDWVQVRIHEFNASDQTTSCRPGGDVVALWTSVYRPATALS